MCACRYGVAYWHNKFPHWPIKVRRCKLSAILLELVITVLECSICLQSSQLNEHEVLHWSNLLIMHCCCRLIELSVMKPLSMARSSLRFLSASTSACDFSTFILICKSKRIDVDLPQKKAKGTSLDRLDDNCLSKDQRTTRFGIPFVQTLSCICLQLCPYHFVKTASQTPNCQMDILTELRFT